MKHYKLLIIILSLLLNLSCVNSEIKEDNNKVITEKFWLEQNYKKHIIYITVDSILLELWVNPDCVGMEDHFDLYGLDLRKVEITEDFIKDTNSYYTTFDKTIDYLNHDTLIVSSNKFSAPNVLYTNDDEIYKSLCPDVKRIIDSLDSN